LDNVAFQLLIIHKIFTTKPENKMYWYDKILNENLIETQNPVNNEFFRWKEDLLNRGNYILQNDNKTFGSLALLNKKGTSAAGKINGDKFFIKKKGVFTEQFEITEENTSRKLTAELKSFNGEEEILTFNNKKIYWRQLNKLDDDWLFFDEENNPMIHFKPVSSFHLSGYYAVILDDLIDKDILPFLLLLGLYNAITYSDKMSLDILLL